MPTSTTRLGTTKSNDKNESGTNGPEDFRLGQLPLPPDATTTAPRRATSRELGSGGSVRVGRPNSSDTGNGPIGSIHAFRRQASRPMYGLSPVFIVVEFSDDAKLSALAIEGANNGEGISLSPGFTANRSNYTATVPNNIDAVSLTATKNESNATVAITDDDDTNTKNQADLDLIVGDTTLTVTVTAQDGSTKTYRITVTRSSRDHAGQQHRADALQRIRFGPVAALHDGQQFRRLHVDER